MVFGGTLQERRCPICIEPLTQSNSIFQPCCRKTLCTTCLFSHIHSILSEFSEGGGRTVLACPFACSSELSDGQVRDSIKRQFTSQIRTVVGLIMFHIILCLGLVAEERYWGRDRKKIGNLILWWNTAAKKRTKYDWWMNLTKTFNERRELRLYERWSLTLALSRSANFRKQGLKEKHTDCDANEHFVHVTRCPRPDCECLWLSNQTYRKRKLKNERKFTNNQKGDRRTSHSSESKIKSISKSLLRAASTWLFYNPLKPEEEVYNEYSTEHWINSESIHVFNVELRDNTISRQRHRDNGEEDGRRLLCPKCCLYFCGLCLRPWSTYSKAGRRVFHSNKLCEDYRLQTVSTKDDDFALTADTVDARSCPGCSMRTSRIQGCNQMVCLCGVEWCYVCECPWNVRHYSCRDGCQISNSNLANYETGCSIS